MAEVKVYKEGTTDEIGFFNTPDWNITVENSAATTVGTVVATEVIIGDSAISLNGVFQGNAPAEQPFNLIATISYNRPSNTQTTSVFSFDAGDHEALGTYTYTQLGIRPIIDDYWNLDAQTPNLHSTLKRFTGSTGGYQDENDSLYYDVSDVLTSEALAFPNDALYDHYTGQIWLRTQHGSAGSLEASLPIANSPTLNVGGFTGGWRIPNVEELEATYNHENISNRVHPIPWKITSTEWHSCNVSLPSITTYNAYSNAIANRATNASTLFNSADILLVRNF